MFTASCPVSVQSDSIYLTARVNGQTVQFIVDTGDSVGPVFNASDAAALGLPQGPPLGVSGAGGASQVYQTQATIELGNNLVFRDEPGAIDANLQGPSLLGLPFFLRNVARMELDFASGMLVLVVA